MFSMMIHQIASALLVGKPPFVPMPRVVYKEYPVVHRCVIAWFPPGS